MKNKLPGVFSKPITRKKFEKTILKYAFVKEYQDFLSSHFILEGEFYVPNFEVQKEDIKKLKTIAKTVKANKGFISTGKIAVIGITFVSIAVFFIFFANAILEQTAENGLEKVFGAKVEITGLRLNLFRMKASFAHISIGDKDQEFKNLFEAGPFILSFNPLAATSRKVFIEDLSAKGLAFGTDRKTSGWTSTPQSRPETDKNTDPLGKILSALNLDVNSIFEEEKGNLGSPEIAEKAAQTWGDKGRQYQDDLDKGKNDYQSLQKTVENIKNFNVAKLSVKDIPALKKQLDTGIKTVETVTAMSAQYASKLKSASEDVSAALKDSSKLIQAANKDMDYLLGFFDFNSTQTKGLFSSLFSRQITRYVGDLYSKVVYAKSIADKIKMPDKNQAAKKKKVQRNLGEKKDFPSSVFPDFAIGFLGAATADKSWDISFRNISSDPDLMPGPTEALGSFMLGQTVLNIKAMLDLRKNEAGLLKANADFDNYLFALGNVLESAGITQAQGLLEGNAELSLDKADTFDGKIVLVWMKPQFTIRQDDSILSKVLTELVADLDQIDFSITARIPVKGAWDIKIESGIDEIMAQKMEKYIASLIKDAEKQIKVYLDEVLEPYKKQLEDGLEKLNAAELQIKNKLDGLNQYKKDLDAKKKEIEVKIKEIEANALGGITLPF